MIASTENSRKRKKPWEIGIWMVILLAMPFVMLAVSKSMKNGEIERRNETSLTEATSGAPTSVLAAPNSYSTFNPKYGPYEELVVYYQEALQMEGGKGNAVKIAIEEAMIDNTVSLFEFEDIQREYTMARGDVALATLLNKADQNTDGVQIESLEKFNEGDFVYEYNEFMDGMIGGVKKTINSLFN